MSDSALEDSLSDSLEDNAVNSLVSLRIAADQQADSLDTAANYDDLMAERTARNQAVMEVVI